MITIYTTGGTFDKIYFDAKSEFSVGEPQAQPILEQAGVNISYQIESLLRKDSLDMDEADRLMIREKVAACSNQRIIIIHGTDGMVATAKYLSQKDLRNKIIVFVGAMQPARMRKSDAPFNLGFAIASVQLLEPGIFIAMNGQVFQHDKVVKDVVASQFKPLT